MKETMTPAQVDRHELPWLASPRRNEPAPVSAPSVHWARQQDEVRAAQRLRHQVFADEMGARLATPLAGHDVDLFDDFCEHLLVRDGPEGEVIGTYRLLTPAQARRIGGTATDMEFDLTRLRDLRQRMVELGRRCIHPAHRQGSVLLAMWSAVLGFMDRNGLDTLIGCASIPLGRNSGSQGGDLAASLWRRLSESHLAAVRYQVQPRLPFPVHRFDASLDAQAPTLIRGYLGLGAEVLGAPAWDPDFHSADLPMLMRLENLPPRWRRHLGGD